jgi:hypothetical protein
MSSHWNVGAGQDLNIYKSINNIPAIATESFI